MQARACSGSENLIEELGDGAVGFEDRVAVIGRSGEVGIDESNSAEGSPPAQNRFSSGSCNCRSLVRCGGLGMTTKGGRFVAVETDPQGILPRQVGAARGNPTEAAGETTGGTRVLPRFAAVEDYVDAVLGAQGGRGEDFDGVAGG